MILSLNSNPIFAKKAETGPKWGQIRNKKDRLVLLEGQLTEVTNKTFKPNPKYKYSLKGRGKKAKKTQNRTELQTKRYCSTSKT